MIVQKVSIKHIAARVVEDNYSLSDVSTAYAIKIQTAGSSKYPVGTQVVIGNRAQPNLAGKLATVVTYEEFKKRFMTRAGRPPNAVDSPDMVFLITVDGTSCCIRTVGVRKANPKDIAKLGKGIIEPVIKPAIAPKPADEAKAKAKELLTITKEAYAKMAAVQKAMSEVKEITIRMPGAFSRMYPGRVHNIDTPTEDSIATTISNLKNLYTLTRDYSETMDEFKWLIAKLEVYK